MTDRTDDFNSAVERLVKHLPQHEALRVKSSVILRKKAHTDSAFKLAALDVICSIGTLRDVIKANQRDFCTPGSISDAECNVIESEIGMSIKAATQQIDQLKASVMAAQQANTKLQASAATKPSSIPPSSLLPAKPIHPQVIAHLHGVVLIAAERLHAVSCIFDKCRSIRYQQLAARKPKQRPSTAAVLPLTSKANGMNLSSGYSASRNSEGGPADQAQAQGLQAESQNLLAQLVRTGQAVSGVERSMIEVSTLFQVFSSAVHSQAEAIEHIYDAACEATQFVAAGNESLVKTIAVNRSSQRYLLVLLMVATLCLLLFDWLNS